MAYSKAEKKKAIIMINKIINNLDLDVVELKQP